MRARPSRRACKRFQPSCRPESPVPNPGLGANTTVIAESTPVRSRTHPRRIRTRAASERFSTLSMGVRPVSLKPDRRAPARGAIDTAQRLQAQVAHGVDGRDSRGRRMPFVGADPGSGQRTLRLGVKLTSGANVEAGLELGRRMTPPMSPERTVQLRGALRWEAPGRQPGGSAERAHRKRPQPAGHPRGIRRPARAGHVARSTAARGGVFGPLPQHPVQLRAHAPVLLTMDSAPQVCFPKPHEMWLHLLGFVQVHKFDNTGSDAHLALPHRSFSRKFLQL